MATYTNIPASATSLNSASYVNIPATSASVTPDQVANLEMWLKADALAGVDGSAVTTWTKSGGASGVSPTQATAGQKPLLKTGANGINGVNVVRFDGTDDVLYGTLDAGAVGFTIFIVGRTGGALSTYGCLVGSGQAAGSDHITSGIRWAFCRGNAADTFGAGWGGPTANVALGDVAGIAINQSFLSRYRTNKVAWSIAGPNSGTPADTSFPTGTFQFYVGGEGTAGGGVAVWVPFNGDIGEVAVYSRALTDGECTSLTAYFTAKWGTLA